MSRPHVRKRQGVPREEHFFGINRDIHHSAIQMLYELTGPSADGNPLNTLDAYSYGGSKELVLAFGEQEISATVGGDGQITFDDVSQLASLRAEDHLAIRLYANNDPENVLWEWAFWGLALGLVDDDALIGENIVYVSADAPSIDLMAVLLGYSGLPDEQKVSAPKFVRWRVVQGQGFAYPAVAPLNEEGVSTTTVTLTPTVGNVVKLEATLEDDEDSSVTSFDIAVHAGKPHQITLSQSGTAKLKGVGSVTVEADIRDRSGNRVEGNN